MKTTRGRACVGLKDALHYRREAFRHGLVVAGYEDKSYISDPGPNDVLVIWNRTFRGAEDAERYQRGGSRILVVENGLLSKRWNGGNWYSLAFNHVAGAGGEFPVGAGQRWESFNTPLAPWRHTETEAPLIFEQRGIGERHIKSPEGWAERTQAQIGGRIRRHPGRYDETVPLAVDLLNASAGVTWASSAGLQALLHGTPVFYACPVWAGAPAALPLSEWGKQPPKRDDAARLALFQRLAWAMWTIDEIENGSAFFHLLGDTP